MPKVTQRIAAPEGTELPANDVIHHTFVQQISRAAEILAAAQARSEEASRTLEEARKAAESEGYSAGHGAGVAQGLVQVSALAEKLQEERLALQNWLIDTVGQCTKRLIASTSPREKIATIVAQAIEEANEGCAIAICVSPASREHLLAERGDETGKLILAGRQIAVEADGALGEDDCLIVYPRHVVDARLETRLEALLKVIEESQPWPAG